MEEIKFKDLQQTSRTAVVSLTNLCRRGVAQPIEISVKIRTILRVYRKVNKELSTVWQCRYRITL